MFTYIPALTFVISIGPVNTKGLFQLEKGPLCKQPRSPWWIIPLMVWIMQWYSLPDPQSLKYVTQSDQVQISCNNQRKPETHTGLPVSSHWLQGLRQDFSQGDRFPVPLLKIAWDKESSNLNKVTLAVQASLKLRNSLVCFCFHCSKPGDGSRRTVHSWTLLCSQKMASVLPRVFPFRQNKYELLFHCFHPCSIYSMCS